MLRTPILISILIAGADSDIDDAEINKAVETANWQHQKNDKDITHYYHEVAQGFEDKLKIIMQQLPTKTPLRNLQIAKELEKLNDILPKLDSGFAAKFYTSLITMAKNVARASGGLLGYLSISYEESKLIGLSMIKKPLAA